MILIQRKQKKAERKAAKLAAKRKAEEEAKKAEAMEETSDEQVWWSSMSVQDNCIDSITNPPTQSLFSLQIRTIQQVEESAEETVEI